MLLIPAGSFIMGTDQDEARRLSQETQGDRLEWYRREQPAHEVVLPDYKIARSPVTVREFTVFIQAGGYDNPVFWSEAGWAWKTSNRITCPEYWGEEPWSGQPDYPVIGVSWYAAQAYCAWLSAATGLPYRLPTEIEWEKAARGPDGRRYPWGNAWNPACCNVNQQSRDSWETQFRRPRPNGLSPVGKFSPQGDSPYGCVDMAGNVWEWCATPLLRYPLTTPRPAVTFNAAEPRVVRGGSWYHGPEDARCAARYCYYPQGQDNVVGFRVAL